MPVLQGLSVVAILAAVTAYPAVPSVRLEPETVAAWDRYVRVVEQHIAGELASAGRFLALEFDADAARLRKEVLAGAIPIDVVDRAIETLDMPSGRIHHWRGAVFVPRATLDEVMSELQTTAPDPAAQEDILASRMLETGRDYVKVFLRLRRQKIVTAVYDTEHLVRFDRRGPGRATTASVATRIAEVRDAGTPDERQLPPGDDRGFLWRLNAYWRYEEVPGGVIAECESVSLSRDVPSVFRFLASPLINGAARESLERTLDAFRRRFAGDVSTP